MDPPICAAHRLWLGSATNSKDAALLHSLGITHILNATAEEHNYFEDKFVYHRVPLYDRTSERSLPFFHDAISFISSALEDNGTVFLHCQEGISRSPTLALAYRMAKEHVPLGECFQQMKEIRPEVEPNRAFLQDLRDWEVLHWGKAMTPQKLTRYDRGELDTNDPRVQLGRYIAAFLVGDAKRVGEQAATQTRNAVRNIVIGVEPADLSRTLAEIICESFENFGGTAARDKAARQNLATILRDIGKVNSVYAGLVKKTATSLGENERWNDLCMDVPLAPVMLNELMAHIS
jgi:protein-tyrosine phosphatase